MDFEKISWATEVSGKDLSDKNILSSPLKAPQFAYKIENKDRLKIDSSHSVWVSKEDSVKMGMPKPIKEIIANYL